MGNRLGLHLQCPSAARACLSVATAANGGTKRCQSRDGATVGTMLKRGKSPSVRQVIAYRAGIPRPAFASHFAVGAQK